MKQILPIIILLSLLLAAVCLFKGCDGNDTAAVSGVVESVGSLDSQSTGDGDETVRKSKFAGSYARVFNDCL